MKSHAYYIKIANLSPFNSTGKQQNQTLCLHLPGGQVLQREGKWQLLLVCGAYHTLEARGMGTEDPAKSKYPEHFCALLCELVGKSLHAHRQ